MGLSPTMTLAGLVSVIAIAVFGVIEAPEKTTEILGFCGTVTAVLLMMLKQDYMVKRIDRNDSKTDDIKKTVLDKGAEVKKALVESDKTRQETLSTIAKTVEEVRQQTNGEFERKIEAATSKLEGKIDKAKEELNQVIQENKPSS